MVYLSSYKISINMGFVSNRSKARYLVVQPSLDLRFENFSRHVRNIKEQARHMASLSWKEMCNERIYDKLILFEYSLSDLFEKLMRNMPALLKIVLCLIT